MRHREHEFAMTNEAMLAEFMARVSQVADGMDQQQPGQPEAVSKLREAVEDLRDVSQFEVDAGVNCCVRFASMGLVCSRLPEFWPTPTFAVMVACVQLCTRWVPTTSTLSAVGVHPPAV